MVASCTPWDASVTVSRSGHFVALMRLRNSVSSASGKFTLNGRIGVLSLPVCCATEVMALFLLKRKKEKNRARNNRCRCGRDHTRAGRSAVLHRGAGTGPDSPGLFTGRHADSTASASIALAKLARAPQRNATASGAGVSARPYIRLSAQGPALGSESAKPRATRSSRGACTESARHRRAPKPPFATGGFGSRWSHSAPSGQYRTLTGGIDTILPGG